MGNVRKPQLALHPPGWAEVDSQDGVDRWGPHKRPEEADGVSTIGDALSAAEAALFVGRTNELKRFQQWLKMVRRKTEVLNVSGPAGIGKSALLRAFRRAAVEHGRTVVFLDVHESGDPPPALLAPFGDPSGESFVVSPGRSRLLLMLDGVRAQTRLSRYVLGTLLLQVEEGTKVVIAGREGLATYGEEGDLWRLMIEPMPLGGVSTMDARLFLSRRGLSDLSTQDRIMRIADGHPLALSLAAHQTLQRGTHDLGSSPEFLLMVRHLADRFLEEVDEPELRPLVSACSVIGPFDEAVLAAISPRIDTKAVFNRLSRLSIVRPTRQGLIVGSEVRRVLASDLRWRLPDEYRALQAWARKRRSKPTLLEPPPASPPSARVWQRPSQHEGLAEEATLSKAVEQLTPREREVLDLLAEGRMSNRDIAEKLVISLGTANLHVKHILHKLGFVNRTELVVWWIQQVRREEQAI